MGKRRNYRSQRKKGRKKRSKLTYKEYSRMCRFKFSFADYPEEFDWSIVENNGWYGESNPNGVSRDHMFSISHGWKKEISPKIIKHPANCRLMLYEDNRDKAWRSSINYPKLKERISEWNKKYK